MQASYFGFIAAAYAMAALALGGLGLWIFLDARQVARRLKGFEGEGRGAKR
ncbi:MULTISPECIES: heme exporter protein CcmD [unclassified Aureimonas]|uniref:heme exporter protein CcmD n=1 Tax=unclassified Aureimonas TaxID=2615206 RepID=UPI0007204B61|nr:MULTISPECIES: heme exporter protein CcmD [unclassified Aureimonas]ALN71682.1 hypothetical protein M673_03095 [Aureimonas sp. AU20]